jgi:hypothetical protein
MLSIAATLAKLLLARKEETISSKCVEANLSIRRSPIFGNERFKPRHGKTPGIAEWPA